MGTDYAVDEVPATPEYVLEVVRDWMREVAGAADPAYPADETPFREWLHLVYWDPPRMKNLRPWFNQTWGTNVTAEEWAAFDPDHATVGDYCRLAAVGVRRPVIRPGRSPAGECHPAGAFLTVRSLLGELGANPNGITPSAPLALYHSRLNSIGERLARLAPGHRPLFRHDYPRWMLAATLIGCVLLLATTTAGVVALVLGLETLAYTLAACAMAYSIGMTIVMRLARSNRVEPAHVRTLSDLAYALAGQQPRRRTEPTS